MGHRVLSLFTGAGGLDLGLEAAGFEPALCVELDLQARATLKKNRPAWVLAQPGDIHALSPTQVLAQASAKPRELSLLAGGPPCQPFSKSSYWAGGDTARLRDPRAKTLNAYLNVVEATLPKVLLLENVKGLAYQGKDEGLKLLELGLQKINKAHRTNYQGKIFSLNAAHFGVPQHRERVFMVASIDGKDFVPPAATHGEGLSRFVTAWDAIGDLDGDDSPDLKATGKWADLLPSIPEGENYLWHTPRNKKPGAEPLFGWRTRYWSFLLKLAKNLPSWTIQALPGPATGPFHWRNRELSVDELARLQTFPRDYKFEGDHRAARRQIGNAVPAAIGELLGKSIRRQFFSEEVSSALSLLPTLRSDCPAPSACEPVDRKYWHLRGEHKDHPGTKKGPAAVKWQKALAAKKKGKAKNAKRPKNTKSAKHDKNAKRPKSNRSRQVKPSKAMVHVVKSGRAA